MSEESAQHLRTVVEELYRSQSRVVLATLIRLLGDFDAAKRPCMKPSMVAVEQWSRDGVPANPAPGWSPRAASKPSTACGGVPSFDALLGRTGPPSGICHGQFRHGRHRWAISRGRPAAADFTCCHPALTPEAQIAMTMREVCGLTTEEIARAFLTKPPTIAQRIVRPKARFAMRASL